METETTYEKGLDLEEKFAEYMRKELGYKKTRVRMNIHGSANAKGKQADVVAEKINENKEMLSSLSKYGIVIGIILLIPTMISGIVNAQLTSDLFKVGVPLVIIGALVLFLGIPNIFEDEHALVECKNLKGKTNINMIDIFLRSLEDYKETGNKEYNFTALYFVSAKGFIENAHKYAIKKGIKCYELNDKNEFIESKYWQES
jgi:hypothetical protein